jgi:hypothetical protein
VGVGVRFWGEGRGPIIRIDNENVEKILQYLIIRKGVSTPSVGKCMCKTDSDLEVTNTIQRDGNYGTFFYCFTTVFWEDWDLE